MRHPLFQRNSRMEWADNLYVSESAAEKKDIIMQKADRGVGMVKVYLITLASNPDNLFDIFHAAHLKQSAFYSQDLKVVGIAESKGEATELVAQMISDIYEQTGEFQVRDYFTFPVKEEKRRKRVRRTVWGK